MWFSSNGWWHPAASRTFHCGLYQCRSSQVICGIHVAVVLQQQLSQFQVPWRHCTPATNYSRGCTCYCYHYYYHKNTHIERDIHLCVCGIYISIYIYTYIYIHIYDGYMSGDSKFRIPGTQKTAPWRAASISGVRPSCARALRSARWAISSRATRRWPPKARGWLQWPPERWKIYGKSMGNGWKMDGKWMEIEFTHGNFRSHLVLHFQNCLQFCKVLVNHGLEIGKP